MQRLRVNGHVARALNEATVFDLLRDRRVISRIELARETGLSKATVSEIVDSFMAAGYLKVLGPGEYSGGRRPVLLEFDPRAHLAIGVGFSDTSITAVVTDLGAEPIESRSTRLRTRSSDEAAIAISDLIACVLDGIPTGKLLGIGLGVPGLVDSRTGVVQITPGWGWRDFPIGRQIADRFGLPVAVVNRAKASALGEAWCGVGKQVSNLAYVLVGTGVSAGIVAGGELYRGVSMSEGELAHVTVMPDGPLCHCGNRGCLRAVATIDAILSQVRERMRAGRATMLTGLSSGRPDLVTFQMVADAAAADDPMVSELILEVGRSIGIATANVVDILNPQMLILGGAVLETIPKMLDAVKSETRRRAVAISSAALTIELSPLGHDAAPIGAAAFLLSQVSPLGAPTLRSVVKPTPNLVRPLTDLAAV